MFFFPPKLGFFLLLFFPLKLGFPVRLEDFPGNNCYDLGFHHQFAVNTSLLKIFIFIFIYFSEIFFLKTWFLS